MILLAQPQDLELLGEEDLPDNRAQALLEAASVLVRRYCGWSVTKSTETFTLDGEGTSLLFLPTARLLEVTAVRVAGQVDTGWSWSTNGIVERAYGWWPTGRRNIQVDTLHGYDPTPADLREVVATIALRVHLNPAGAASESFAGATTAWPVGLGLTQAERAILDGYSLGRRA